MAVNFAIVHHPDTMLVHMVIFPDFDSQLDDPAYNPPGLTHVRIPLSNIVDNDAHAAIKRAVPNIIIPGDVNEVIKDVPITRSP